MWHYDFAKQYYDSSHRFCGEYVGTINAMVILVERVAMTSE